MNKKPNKYIYTHISAKEWSKNKNPYFFSWPSHQYSQTARSCINKNSHPKIRKHKIYLKNLSNSISSILKKRTVYWRRVLMFLCRNWRKIWVIKWENIGLLRLKSMVVLLLWKRTRKRLLREFILYMMAAGIEIMLLDSNQAVKYTRILLVITNLSISAKYPPETVWKKSIINFSNNTKMHNHITEIQTP